MSLCTILKVHVKYIAHHFSRSKHQTRDVRKAELHLQELLHLNFTMPPKPVRVKTEASDDIKPIKADLDNADRKEFVAEQLDGYKDAFAAVSKLADSVT